MRTTISNSELTAVINHAGAELISLKAKNTDKEYIWEGNPAFWGKHSPVLFPIVGTLKNNSFSFKGETYSLSRHGFARDMVFDLITKSENQAVFSLQSDKGTKRLFPFDFELQIKYAIENSTLKVTYIVINKDNETMFYSIGGHPAFALLKQFEDYSLQFEENEDLISYQLENDLLSNNTRDIELIQNKLPLTYSLFEKDALIFKELRSKQIRLLENNIPIFDFSFSDFPNFGIWTKANAPFICLEPWAGYSDVINTSGNIEEKESIQKLKSNTTKRHSFSVEIL